MDIERKIVAQQLYSNGLPDVICNINTRIWWCRHRFQCEMCNNMRHLAIEFFKLNLKKIEFGLQIAGFASSR